MTIFKSRTFWTSVVVFVYFGLTGAVHTFTAPFWINDLIGGLGFLLVNYFHFNPTQSYGDSTLAVTPK
jgi:hypothetical protein